MPPDSSEEFLQKMKSLVRKNKRYFAKRNRKGVTFLQQIAYLGLTSIDEAWKCILDLEVSHYFDGPDIDRDNPQDGLVVWIYKMEINGTITYIKLKDESGRRGCVCLSFHEDESNKLIMGVTPLINQME